LRCRGPPPWILARTLQCPQLREFRVELRTRTFVVPELTAMMALDVRKLLGRLRDLPRAT